jgi:hypothetical protein
VSEGRLKVLYIAGNGRSGSTLLDVILGQVPGFFPVGEVRNVWDYGVVENRPCGCGEAFGDCAVWTRILGGAFGDELPDAAGVAASREAFAQTKRLLPMLAFPGRYEPGRRSPELDAYLGILERLYHGIARATGSRVVVDSSKWPAYAFLLDRIPSIDLHVLHLVRDPRACAFSWTRKKEGEPGRLLDRQGPVYTTSYWVVWNPVIRHLWQRRAGRYRFLRYEDFVQRPRESVQGILDFVGESAAGNPFKDDRHVDVSATHTIEGNFTRFLRGEVEIRADQEWQDRMPAGSRAIVTAMTWPYLLRYGYW